MRDDEVMKLCDVIRETSYAIHCYHQSGHLEKIDENALANRLIKNGITLKQQFPLKVFDEDGTILGDYFADLFVENSLIVELKACRFMNDEHTAQILGYLKSSRMKHGLLINFGAPRLQIKKYVL